MQPIKGCGYRQGKIGKTKIDNPGIPYHAFHNHGSGQTFSVTDIKIFSENDNMLSITAIGNTGNRFVLIKDIDFDKYGFSAYIIRKSQEPLLINNGIIFSLESLSNRSNIEIIKSLSKEQVSILEKSVIQKSIEIAEGGASFGFRYTTS